MSIQAAFWDKVDQLVASSEIVIDRPRGTAHPRYPQMIYPVDYGYLQGTSSGDGQGIDVWRGASGEMCVNALLCCVDVLKRDMEIKLLLACTDEEIRQIMALMNESDYMQCDIVYRDAVRE